MPLYRCVHRVFGRHPRSAARRLERGFLPHLQALLASAPVLHADETPGRAAGGLAYVHVAWTEYLTALHVGDRSAASIDAGAVLPTFSGTLVRDGYAGYAHLSGVHAWCAAHLLRDLRSISDADPDGQLWAAAMATALTDAYHTARKARERGVDTRLLIRRVRLDPTTQLSTDPRARRRRTPHPAPRTPHPDQRILPIAELAGADAVYAYSFILTNLDISTPDNAAAVEHWYRHRTMIENIVRGSKHGPRRAISRRDIRGSTPRGRVGGAARGQHRWLAPPTHREPARPAKLTVPRAGRLTGEGVVRDVCVGEAQLHSGVRSFPAHDHPHPGRPAGGAEVTEHPGQLGDIGALAGAAVGVDRLRPRFLRQGQDRSCLNRPLAARLCP